MTKAVVTLGDQHIELAYVETLAPFDHLRSTMVWEVEDLEGGATVTIATEYLQLQPGWCI